MNSDLQIATQPGSITAAIDQCDQIDVWAETADNIPALLDVRAQAAGIREYLRAKSTEGDARVAATERRLEARIGVLLGEAKTGRPEGKNVHRDEPSLTPQQRSAFRKMATDTDTVEDIIANSTDERPASRRQILDAIKAKEQDTGTIDTSGRPGAPKPMTAEEYAALHYNEGLRDLYTGIAIAIDTLSGYGGYADIGNLWDEFEYVHLKPQQLKEMFTEERLDEVIRLADWLKEWIKDNT